MNSVVVCEKCGTKIDRQSELPCPGCLMQLGMANWGEYSAVGTELPPTRTASGNAGGHFGGNTNGTRNAVAEIIEAQFPGLEIVELLGEGGMGMVFKARQTSLQRDVAVKVIRTDHQHREAFENRFAREARALASLNHPNIVTVHDFGKTADYFFLIMEFVDGINLRDLLSGQRISPREALEIIPQICDALQYAHDQGVVHRDIKPENILVDRNGRVKIADYGLAKLVNERGTSASLTQTHHVMGTPHYMAPEQVEKPLSVDHRADIYSLGVVIYEMLTGELPLGRFDLPSEKNGWDKRVDEIVIHTLEKEPARRYQKASEVKTDFESVLSDSPPVASQEPSPTTRPDASPRQVAPPKPVPQPAPQPWFPVQPPLQPVHSLQPAKPQKPADSAHQNPYEAAAGPRNNWSAMLSPQTYLNATYLLISFPLSIACFVLSIFTLAVGLPLTIVWVGLFILWGGFHLLDFLFAIERQLCKWLLREEIPYRRPALDHTTVPGKLTAVMTSSSTWWGILYSLIRLPWSVICLTSVIVFFTVPLMLLAAPILFTRWWFHLDIDGFEVNTLPRAILAALLAFPVFYLGVQLNNALAFASGKISRFFLTRR